MKPERKNEGFVLTGVLMLMLIATLVGGAFLFSARNSFATVDKWRERDDCLSAIQSGIELREYELFLSLPPGQASIEMLNPLANKLNEIWTNRYVNNWSTDPSVVSITGTTSSGAVTIDVTNNTAVVTITNIARAKLGQTTRVVREVVTYTYSPPGQEIGGDRGVFDNAFFIDNIGVFSGVNCDFNGDVYANKNMDLRFSSMKVNGDSYAGAKNLATKIYQSDEWGTPSSAGEYGSQSYANARDFSQRVRPAEYTTYDTTVAANYWPQGYKGTCNFYDNQKILKMPFIGPISEYAAFAIAKTGGVTGVHSVSAEGVLTRSNLGRIPAVWGDAPDGSENAGIGVNDRGCLILIGTEADPIVLNGVFVATGDIYIKGYYTGQGTLYSGRNIYVIGDLIAKDPAKWPHPDNNPSNTAAINRKRDFLGLCAKGSLSVGDLSKMLRDQVKNPFTASHATDISDIELGYVTHYVNGVPFFNGDYTAKDGNGSQLRSDNTDRLFYTPMLGSDSFRALGGTNSIVWMDAILYANHLIAGDYGNNAVLNGAMICRDESIVRYGNLSYNWDIRLGSKSKDGENFHPGLLGTFPSSARITKIVKWTELAP